MAEVEEHKKAKLVEQAQSGAQEKHQSFRLTHTVQNGVNGFTNFIREQGVIGLAVGLSLGTAVTVFVKSIVDNIITPLIGTFLPGGQDLNTKYVCLKYVSRVCTNKLGWGIVVSNLISFVAIAALIYFVIHGFKLDRLDKKKDDSK
jgi:large conductance mechanosensitive channel